MEGTGKVRVGDDKISEAEYVEQYKKALHYCLNLTGGRLHDAEDLTGEAFHLFFLERDRLFFESPAALTTWLYRTCKNKWMKQVRHAKRKPPDIDETDLFGDEFDGMEEEKQYLAYIAQIEGTLSENDLELFRAIVVEQLPYPEVAKQMGISEQAMRVRWFRLRQKIRPTVEKMLIH